MNFRLFQQKASGPPTGLVANAVSDLIRVLPSITRTRAVPLSDYAFELQRHQNHDALVTIRGSHADVKFREAEKAELLELAAAVKTGDQSGDKLTGFW